MPGDIVGKILMAIAVGAAFGLFYTLLLNLHGFTKIRYKYVALIIGTIIVLLGLYSFEAAGIGCFIIGIGVFVLAIAYIARSAAYSLKALSVRLSPGNTQQREALQQVDRPGISNYTGVVFHFVVIILISLSIFTYSDDTVLDQVKMDNLIGDAVFQFSSTVMLILLGIFNPFVAPSQKLLGLANRVDSLKYPKLYLLLSGKIFWTVLKTFICLGIVLYTVSKGYFNLISWNSAAPYMNVYIIMIGFFIFINLVQMIRNPEYFFKKNLFRISMLVQSAFVSIFLSAILVFATMFISTVLGADMDRLKVSSETIIFLGFNIIMCYNEFRLARA